MRICRYETGRVAPGFLDPHASNLRISSVRAFQCSFECVFYAELRLDGSANFLPPDMPEQSLPKNSGLLHGKPDGLEETSLFLGSQ